MSTFFGTDGIRGPVATSPFLTPSFLHRFGAAVARWAQQQHGAPVTIVLGNDTRASCAMIERALASGVSYAGGYCVSAGITPTPGLQHLVRSHRQAYQYGIMISASHNPATDNGLKLLTPNGKLTKEQEAALSDVIEQTKEIPVCRADDRLITPLPAHHAISYHARLSTFFPSRLFSGLSIALDCAHGATYELAHELFTSCGATVKMMGNKPNGHNINGGCGSTHPAALQHFVKTQKVDLGFAFDGDGDRVIAVNKAGEVIDGDHLLGLLASHPRFAQHPVVGTVMSNIGLEQWLREQGRELIRTPVGDSHVLHAMNEHNTQLGGEPSGHIIVGSYLPSADGLFTALFAAHTALLTENLALTTFDKCPQASINVPVTHKHDLTSEPYASIIRTHTPATGRSIVRYSGTEPLLRIMVEDHTHDDAQTHATTLANKLKPLLIT